MEDELIATDPEGQDEEIVEEEPLTELEPNIDEVDDSVKAANTTDNLEI